MTNDDVEPLFPPECFVISSKLPLFLLSTFSPTINCVVLLSACPCTWQNCTDVHLSYVSKTGGVMLRGAEQTDCDSGTHIALAACIAIVKTNGVSCVYSYIHILMPCWLDRTH